MLVPAPAPTSALTLAAAPVPPGVKPPCGAARRGCGRSTSRRMRVQQRCASGQCHEASSQSMRELIAIPRVGACQALLKPPAAARPPPPRSGSGGPSRGWSRGARGRSREVRRAGGAAAVAAPSGLAAGDQHPPWATSFVNRLDEEHVYDAAAEDQKAADTLLKSKIKDIVVEAAQSGQLDEIISQLFPNKAGQQEEEMEEEKEEEKAEKKGEEKGEEKEDDGFGTFEECATEFVLDLLSFAVEDHVDEAVHEVSDEELEAPRVLPVPEPTIEEGQEEEDVEEEDEVEEAVLVLDEAVYGGDEEERPVLDIAADVAEDMAMELMQHAFEAIAEQCAVPRLLPATALLPPCVRRSFPRRLCCGAAGAAPGASWAADRRPPVPAEVFPAADCLPPSAPVALSQPPLPYWFPKISFVGAVRLIQARWLAHATKRAARAAVPVAPPARSTVEALPPADPIAPVPPLSPMCPKRHRRYAANTVTKEGSTSDAARPVTAPAAPSARNVTQGGASSDSAQPFTAPAALLAGDIAWPITALAGCPAPLVTKDVDIVGAVRPVTAPAAPPTPMSPIRLRRARGVAHTVATGTSKESSDYEANVVAPPTAPTAAPPPTPTMAPITPRISRLARPSSRTQNSAGDMMQFQAPLQAPVRPQGVAYRPPSQALSRPEGTPCSPRRSLCRPSTALAPAAPAPVAASAAPPSPEEETFHIKTQIGPRTASTRKESLQTPRAQIAPPTPRTPRGGRPQSLAPWQQKQPQQQISAMALDLFEAAAAPQDGAAAAGGLLPALPASAVSTDSIASSMRMADVATQRLGGKFAF